MVEEQEEKTFGNRVIEAVSQKTTTKTITINFPKPTYKRFSKWAFENAGDCYWLAIDKLLNDFEQKIGFLQEIQFLIERDDVLLNEINQLKEHVGVVKEVPKNNHFGKKGE